ncbi:MAG: bacillithiol system redox-active protein YtxJ [Saprospirales bacterium]|nr:MAG: bacillithiol system redox-active protein YtxJ [Saprospirales bacterium]
MIMLRTETNIPGDWINIDSWEKVEQAIKWSDERPVFIFKHSTRCGLSAQAKNELEVWSQKGKRELSIFYLDLLTHRDISNRIATITKVAHQSPQLIAIANGEAVDAISHSSIEENELNHFYNKIFPLVESTGAPD